MYDKAKVTIDLEEYQALKATIQQMVSERPPVDVTRLIRAFISAIDDSMGGRGQYKQIMEALNNSRSFPFIVRFNPVSNEYDVIPKEGTSLSR